MALLVSYRQLGLPLPASSEEAVRPRRGGARPGAGRKRVLPGRPRVPHRTRPAHQRGEPLHVTMRARSEASFLRTQRVFLALRAAFGRASRGTFRVVHFSVQRDHVHLLVEASDRASLESGMRGLGTRLARAVNRALRRRGRVWADRHHRRALTSPRAVRNALVYVLQNGAKHGARGLVVRGALVVDPLSSARWLAGWTPRAGPLLDEARAHDEDDVPCVAAPRTWLLRVGWARAGRVDPGERPGR